MNHKFAHNASGELTLDDWCHSAVPDLRYPPDPNTVQDPLSQHLLCLYRSKIHIPEEEFFKAAEEVNLLVNKLLKDLRLWLWNNQASFTVNRLIASGSAAEGLKAGAPDEFDVMLELEVAPGVEYNVHLRNNMMCSLEVTAGRLGYVNPFRLEKDLSDPQYMKMCILLAMRKLKYKCFESGGPSILIELNEFINIDIVPALKHVTCEKVLLVPVKTYWRVSLSLIEIHYFRKILVKSIVPVILIRLFKFYFSSIKKKYNLASLCSFELQNLILNFVSLTNSSRCNLNDLGDLTIRFVHYFTETFCSTPVKINNVFADYFIETLSQVFTLHYFDVVPLEGRVIASFLPLWKLQLQLRLFTYYDFDVDNLPLIDTDRTGFLQWLPSSVTEEDILNYCNERNVCVESVVIEKPIQDPYRAAKIIFKNSAERNTGMATKFWCELPNLCHIPAPILLEWTPRFPPYLRIARGNDVEFVDEEKVYDHFVRNVLKNKIGKFVDEEWYQKGVQIIRDPDPDHQSRVDSCVMVVMKGNLKVVNDHGFQWYSLVDDVHLLPNKNVLLAIRLEFVDLTVDELCYIIEETYNVELDYTWYRNGIWIYRHESGNVGCKFVLKSSDELTKLLYVLYG